MKVPEISGGGKDREWISGLRSDALCSVRPRKGCSQWQGSLAGGGTLKKAGAGHWLVKAARIGCEAKMPEGCQIP